MPQPLPRQVHALLFTCSLALTSASALADVDARNGNFSVTYRDLRPAVTLELRRTYNSLSSEQGWFGSGWGSAFETRLITFPDGSAAVRENGSGAWTYYGKPGGPAVEKTVRKIMEAEAQRKTLSAKERDQLEWSLINNVELRARKAMELGLRNTMLEMTPLSSRQCSSARLVPERAHYTRTLCDGTQDRFDLDGRLHSRSRGLGQKVIGIWNKNGQLQEMRDEHQNALTFQWNGAGQIASVQANSAQRMEYRYDKKGRLTSTSGTTTEPAYRYEYDDANRMTAIRYIDTTARLFSYSSNGRIMRVTERTGEETSYRYSASQTELSVTRTIVTSFDSKGNRLPNETRKYAWRDLLLSELENAEGQWAFGYDENEQIQQIQMTDPQGKRSRAIVDFDASGRIKRIRYFSDQMNRAGMDVSYEYDQHERVYHASVQDAGNVAVKYDSSGTPYAAEGSSRRATAMVEELSSAFERLASPLHLKAPL